MPDFWNTHFFGVTFVVMDDVVFYPLYIGIFGARGVMFETKGISVLVE